MLNRSLFLAGMLTLPLALAACSGGTPGNRSLDSVHQPVVQRQVFALDLQAGAAGLPAAELRRLDEWFTAYGVGYGDKVALSGLTAGAAARDQITALLAPRGLVLAEIAPVNPDGLAPGLARVSIARAHASVPGCPDWSGRTAGNLGNATSAGYGCAVNSNLAAMIADPEHLLVGAKDAGPNLAGTAAKAVAFDRAREPTGVAGLRALSSSED